jgi:hypothetical protein
LRTKPHCKKEEERKRKEKKQLTLETSIVLEAYREGMLELVKR